MSNSAFVNIQVQKAILFIQEAILKKKIDVNDPFKLIKDGFLLVASLGVSSDRNVQKQITLKAIERIAAGADGISGTDDDLIPVEIVQKLGALVNTNLLGNAIDFISEHEQTLSKIAEVAPSCLKPLLAKVLGLVRSLTKAKASKNA